MVLSLTSPSHTASPNQSLAPVTSRINTDGHLDIGGCDVVHLAQKYSTPLYIVDEETFRQGCRQYREAFAELYPGPVQVLYATKAWNCLALCALALQEGLGLDVASGGELYTALQVGASGADIYLHGNAKSRDELLMALEVGATIVVDSLYELKVLADIVATSPVLQPHVMLRVNPGIDVHTHEYIRTGQIDSKFGLGQTQLPQAFEWFRAYPQIQLTGLHAHIGSQIFDTQGHQDLGGVLSSYWTLALQYDLTPSALNVGGGLGVRYVESDDPPSIRDWVAAVCQGVRNGFESVGLSLPKLLCEPGRSLAAPAAVTAYTIGGTKQIPPSDDLPSGRTYVTIDGGMSDNPRPITYQAAYTPTVANRPQAELNQQVTIAGKHCESGDLLLRDIMLPELRAGDTLVVFMTGAYTYSMASNYNRFPRPAAVLVREGRSELIIQRETYADVVRQDVLPSHLQR